MLLVGKDVAQALGYENQNRDIQRHIESEDRILLGEETQYQNGIEFDYKTLGQRGGCIINESGLFSQVRQDNRPASCKAKAATRPDLEEWRGLLFCAAFQGSGMN